MAIRIQKWEVEQGQNPIQMPDGATLLALELSPRSSQLWVVGLVDTAQADRERRIYVAPHDSNLPAGAVGWPFIGSQLTRVPPRTYLVALDAGWAP